MRYIETFVPQGSVLGRLLFSVYINDLPSCSNMFKMIMYADDTSLLCDLNNDNDIETLIHDELCKITNWLLANQLSLNVNKTKFMVFYSSTKHVVYPILSINGTVIERVDTFNFLGLHISYDLKWKTHIQTMSQKLSKITGILHRLEEQYPSSILKSIYNTLMLPHLNYCILSWGFQCQEIYLLQKRATRNIEKAGYRAHTEPNVQTPTITPPPPPPRPPPPHMPICNPFNILLLIRMASFSLYCHIRNWFIHEIDNHIVDLHL